MDDAHLSADRSAIFAFFALNAIALPAGWFDTQAFPATSTTAAFAGRSLMLAGGACVLFVVCEHPRWYRRHRTFVLSTLYTAMWLVLCTAHFYLLSWADCHNSVGTAANSIALGITLHLILPLNPKRAALDLSVICTILAMHAATAGYYLDAEPAKQFAGVLLIMMMSSAAVFDARLYRCVAWSDAQGQDDDDAAAAEEDEINGGKSVSETASETVRSRFRSREALDREKRCDSLLPEHKESRCLRRQLQSMQAECADRHEKLATTQSECDEEKAKLAASVKAHAETQVAYDEEKAKLVASVKAHAETHAECDEETRKLVASVKAHAETHAECDEEKAKLAASFKAHAETQVTCDEETAKLAASVKAHAETHAECDEETRKLVASVKAHAETHAECDVETRKLVASVKAHAETQVAYDEEKAKLAASVKAHALTQAEAESKGNRVINHTSKRVMSNTSLMCELALKQLSSFTLSEADDATRSVLLERLRRTLAESIAGFHMCKTVLLQTSIISGEYHPVREEFTLEQIFEHLGLSAALRVVIDAADTRSMRADKALLTSILFNASQNALVHGEQGGTVHVGAVLSDGSPSYLTVAIRNAPGVNHAKLFAFTQAKGNADLLAIRAGEGSAPSNDQRVRTRGDSSELCKPSRELSKMAVGTVDSTYLGLGAILRDAQAFNPPARTSLAIGAHEVAFSITLDVVLVEQDASAAEMRVLPAGLVFVWLDDDDMPRIYADAVLRAAKANLEASLILGETYEEAKTCLARVMELSAAHGEERMIVLLDQNIDQYHECATEGVIQGTEICRELRTRGFFGTIAICSANDESKDEYEYLQAGANVSIGKGLAGGLSAILYKLADAHFKTREALSTRDVPLA